MQGFLREVAGDLWSRYETDISSLSILFPSRRAQIFFADALTGVADRPLWQPDWLTIDTLMCEASGLHNGDKVRLITELYKVYSKYHKEPFDKFYFWGEMLLADFDTIDKYLVDADMLFRNIYDIKELEADVSYLTPVQLKILSFWSTFGEEATLSDEKRNFLVIWRTLANVYHEFKTRLLELGMAYNGMIQRAAVERMSNEGFVFEKQRRYVIVGFNALSECEKRLFKYLATTADAEFYWDYDSYYKDDTEQEAGMFVRDNLSMFPPCADISHDNMVANKSMTVVSTSSNAVQCKYVASILEELAAKAPLDKRTAIVLTDENLLLPLLYSLPESIGKVNVTMGYPLRHTSAYTFVERLIAMQSHSRQSGAESTFYYADVIGILSHPYLNEIDAATVGKLRNDIVDNRRIHIKASALRRSELLNILFFATSSWSELSTYLLELISYIARQPYGGDDVRQRVEFLAVISENITKLTNSLQECDIELSVDVFISLLRRHLQTLRIPFEGEPLNGIQVMGILETRNLDFDNVIVLSMNDSNFPGNHVAQASFVPYNLRSAYDLPTPEHHEGVYAYYFYRLIQRAQNIYMLYCSHADEKTTGEPSRYIHQIDYESPFEIDKVTVGVDVNLAETAPIEVPKSEDVEAALRRFLDVDAPRTLSPTAFFRYVACPLRFYFHSIARLQADDNIAEDVDAPMFGTILHAAVQQLYTRVEGEYRPGQMLRQMAKSGDVSRAVEAAINEHYLCNENALSDEYTGNMMIVSEIVTKYIADGIMPYDALHDDFTLVGLEKNVNSDFDFKLKDECVRVRFAGVADRIDSLPDGTQRVIDYKTGAAKLDFDGLESLFNGEGKQRLSNVLQTLLYSMMIYHSTKCDVKPALYYVRNMNRDDYSPQIVDKELKISNICYSFYKDRFEKLLREKLVEIFDVSTPFRQCDDRDTCQYCDFKEICKR